MFRATAQIGRPEGVDLLVVFVAFMAIVDLVEGLVLMAIGDLWFILGILGILMAIFSFFCLYGIYYLQRWGWDLTAISSFISMPVLIGGTTLGLINVMLLFRQDVYYAFGKSSSYLPPGHTAAYRYARMPEPPRQLSMHAFCSRCGAGLQSTSAFCPSCGARIG